jgi:hypothetical protein
MKPGPPPGTNKTHGSKGGRSRPSLKKTTTKQGARHSIPKGKPKVTIPKGKPKG